MLDMKKVLVGGVFDILHYGHIHFLSNAKKLGDKLIVALESDENVKRIKGPKRPIHDQKRRSEMLKSLSFVDEVIVLKDKMTDTDYRKLVENVHPWAIAVTKEDPHLTKKKAHAKSVGARLFQIPKIKTASTSQIAKLLGIE